MDNTITLRRVCPAFLAAVTAAATWSGICGMLLAGIPPLPGALYVFGFAWLLAAAGGILPFALGIHVANRLGIRHWAYFTVGGMLAALTALGVLFGVDAYACEDEPPILPADLVLHVAISGAIAGAACWQVLRRQERLETSVRMS